MARIVLPASHVGNSLTSLANQVNQATEYCARLLAVVNVITANGANTVNLESSAESLMPAGSGATIYAGLTQINTALAGLAATMAVIDQGY